MASPQLLGKLAVRIQEIDEFRKVWEWRSNSFNSHTDHEPSRDGVLANNNFDSDQISLCGSSIYTLASFHRPNRLTCFI